MKSLDISKIFEKEYKGVNPKELSPLVLAYIGDSIFEILVRTVVISEGNAPVNRLHKKAKLVVNAAAQAAMFFRIENCLTPEEMSVFKRGRNAKSYTVPKNADISDYRHATGLEAVFGYLYLDGKLDRAIELFNYGMMKE